MRWSAACAALCLVAALGLVACGGDDGGTKTATTFVKLDGTPRRPDVEGVVAKVAKDFSTITLDGDRTYDVSPALQSFSTIDGSTIPLLGRVGQYVQVGLRGDTALWVATVADVTDGAGDPVVYYTGELVDHDNKRLTFKDGTVLTLGPDVEVPDGAMHVIVTIDPSAHVVTTVVNG